MSGKKHKPQRVDSKPHQRDFSDDNASPNLSSKVGAKVRGRIYLVDFENTASNIFLTVDKLRDVDELYLFYTAASERVNIELIIALKNSPAKVKLVRCENGSPNALDFQLSCYLGLLIGTRGSSVDYIVVSDDNGYRKIRGLASNFGVHVGFVKKDAQAPVVNKSYGDTIDLF